MAVPQSLTSHGTRPLVSWRNVSVTVACSGALNRIADQVLQQALDQLPIGVHLRPSPAGALANVRPACAGESASAAPGAEIA
jgi:hypothetical protein